MCLPARADSASHCQAQVWEKACGTPWFPMLRTSPGSSVHPFPYLSVQAFLLSRGLQWGLVLLQIHGTSLTSSGGAWPMGDQVSWGSLGLGFARLVSEAGTVSTTVQVQGAERL